MSVLLEWMFWLSCASVAYVYAGYPLVLKVWSRLRPQVIRPIGPEDVPPISIVIAARNEANALGARIENLLSLEYPADCQIIVVSDGSTDETAIVLADYQQQVEGVLVPAGGKARALNAGVAHARHDIIVFADARQVFAPGALRELVAPFRDPAVGVVSGELLFVSGDSGSTIAEGIGLYWNYEKSIRRDESAIHSTLGATGAIYAIRRSTWTPLPPDTILDDVLTPMRAVLGGYRSVFNGLARAFDRPSANAKAESRRKVRTLAGNFQLVCLEPRLLLPWRNPVWLQFFSHKVGRLLVPYALVLMLVSSACLAPWSSFYAAAFAAQLMLYALAIYGAWLDEHQGGAHGRESGDLFARLARVALTFLVLNASAVAGLWMFALHKKVWR
jgi:cellulose synthase/poly-beta-1,6-N-acetylglucosamine synthase-like glycosyltransferase